ncbi:MAG: hypothetical protein IPL61_31745 [Myxococcales bacterium]|nr:hypothetical protein [Myxococcales bacterium]
MVVAERWAEQRVLMRAYAESPDQTRPTIVLHGAELAIGPASTDPNGSWGVHVQPPVDGRAQELQAQLELAARRMAGSKNNPPRLEDESGTFERKRTNNWAPGSPKDVPEAPLPRASWDPAVAASQHLPAYLAASPGASTIAPGQVAAVVTRPAAVAVPAEPSASYVPAAPAAEVVARGQASESSLAVMPATNALLRLTPVPSRQEGGRARRQTAGPRVARTALGYSSGAGAQSAIIRLGLRPAAAARLGRLADRTVPADFQISSAERDVLNLLAERERVSARAVRELVGIIDAVAWMEALMAKLESFGLDLIAPGDADGSEPTYRLRW